MQWSGTTAQQATCTQLCDLQVNGDCSGAAAQSWLAPRPHARSSRDCPCNTVTLNLPHAIVLSKLRVWNYHKNPERGACEVDVLLDDQLIYSGYLARASSRPFEHQTLLFSNDAGDMAAEHSHVKNSVSQMDKGHLTLINEKVVKNQQRVVVAPSERPATALVQ
jgi:Domain of unknown function (DUF4457)